MSITDHRQQRGQVIVLFTLFLFVLLLFAALAFDVGQTMVDRRKQQNAADAGALAGVRYIANTSPTFVGRCSSDPGASNQAVHQACQVAAANGYVDGGTNVVAVKIPPGPESRFSGLPGYIEVNIGTTRGSIFRGRGIPAQWNVAAMGVAANTTGATAPYSMLILNSSKCGALNMGGQGTVVVGSNVQVNSSCSTNALDVSGQASIDVTLPQGGVNVTGGTKITGGHASVDPTPTNGAPAQPDPLLELPPPPKPAAPASVVKVSGSGTAPTGCPGGTSPATDANPGTGCNFTSTYAGSAWRLFPGYYPGGLTFKGGTFYLEPGIYYLGGGGLTANGTGAAVYSVDPGGTTLAGGVMFYNTQATNPCTGTGCLASIDLNGSAALIKLHALATGDYAGLVIFQDRTLALASGSGDIKLNGNGGNLNLVGTVYVPKGNVVMNGNGGTMNNTVQIITDSLNITGQGTFNTSYDSDKFFKLSGIGLVQ